MKIGTFNKLKKYESFLYTAKYGNYIRSLTSTQLEDLIKAGADIDINYKYNHCPICVLNFVKKLADPYFIQKEKNENNKKLKEEKDNKDENRG